MTTNNTFHITIRASLFLALLGILAWISGKPLLFPSLGPTAYVLGFDNKAKHSAKVVIGGHFCGIVGGLASFYLLVHPYTLQTFTDPLSTPGFFLAAGGILAIALTALFMISFKASHPPACATTLIISLGILSTWTDAVFILLAVVIMYGSYRGYHFLISSA